MTVQLNRERSELFVDETWISTDKRPWFGQLPEELGGDFSFAVMGDRCGMMTAGVFEQGLELLQDLRPDFVLFVGDLVEGYWKNAEDARGEWAYIDGVIAKAGLPFFQTIGNHDFGTQAMADVWHERKGHEYYAFRTGGALFLVLNTEDPFEALPDEFIEIVKRATANVHREPEHALEHLHAFNEEIIGHLTPEQMGMMFQVKLGISDRQLAFFEKVLAEHADVQHTFVSMHKPGWKADNANFARLEQLLAARPYTVFAGHFHTLEHSRTENRTCIQLGRTGAAPHGTGRADDNLMLWVNVRGGQPSFRVIHLDGVTPVEDYAPKLHAHSEG
ncbi:metallophosphoesterase family protein [Paenibacillus tepidiphilus]|uniref:metallophosphoesterase family protein n=1 Tax=Paenibacillus tepidiphilus TaxID=2608683 RepID=UPI0012387811|nr:metallophosphoesterase [Paenibacillus tepidiphilus]